jgi:hypothetical protein
MTLSMRILFPALFLLLSACRGGTYGPQFVGKWQDTANPSNTLEISTGNDRYVLNEHDVKGDHNYIATIEQNKLTIIVGNAPTKQIFYHDNSDTLEWGGSSFKRAR